MMFFIVHHHVFAPKRAINLLPLFNIMSTKLNFIDLCHN